MTAGPFEFDPAKNESNRRKHGVGLDEFRGFDSMAAVIPDTRADYGEERFSAFGTIAGLGYNLVFTPRTGRLRLISFRRAHREEMEQHEGKPAGSR